MFTESSLTFSLACYRLYSSLLHSQQSFCQKQLFLRVDDLLVLDAFETLREHVSKEYKRWNVFPGHPSPKAILESYFWINSLFGWICYTVTNMWRTSDGLRTVCGRSWRSVHGTDARCKEPPEPKAFRLGLDMKPWRRQSKSIKR